MFRYALAASLTAMLMAGGARAAAFALMDMDASGLGNAQAGRAAAAEDAGTVFHNPAGLVYVDSRQMVMAATMHLSRLRFRDDDPASLGDGGDAGRALVSPSVYYAGTVTPDIRVGLGINRPFGVDIAYQTPWAGQTRATSTRVRSTEANPAVAWRASSLVAVGVGLSWRHLEVETTRLDAVNPAAAPIKLRGDDGALGWNAGVIWDADGFTRVGMTYRSSTRHRAQGRVGGAAARVDFDLPDTWSLSLWQRLNPRWEVLADVTRTGWSNFDPLDNQVTDDGWEDAWRLSLGVNYRHSREWTWRVGVAYDESPVPDAQRRSPRLPDADRTWVAMGGQYRLGPYRAVDFGYAHGFVRDARSEHSESGNTLRGLYQSRHDLLGMQYTHGF